MKAKTLDSTADFLYLSCTVAFNNSNWADLYQNLRKAQIWWGVVTKVLTSIGAAVWAHSVIYKAVLRTVLIYWIDIYVVMDQC